MPICTYQKLNTNVTIGQKMDDRLYKYDLISTL